MHLKCFYTGNYTSGGGFLEIFICKMAPKHSAKVPWSAPSAGQL